MANPKESSGEVAPVTGDMSAEEFRRFGHEIVDWIANYFEHIEDLPVLAQGIDFSPRPYFVVSP